jgi:hypothetical protein
MNARKHREIRQAKETERLEPKGKQLGSSSLAWLDANVDTAGVKSGPKSSGEPCITWKSCQPCPGSQLGRPHRKAGQEEQHWDDRKSQCQRVMLWIRPRRSGLKWRENGWNRGTSEKANDGRRQSADASGRRRFEERSTSRLYTSIAKPRGYRFAGCPQAGWPIKRIRACLMRA